MEIPPPDARRPLVLIVDDDDQMRAYIRLCLSRLSVQVIEAVDGQDALGRIEAEADCALALVVTDVLMPQLDGLGLKAALRSDQRWAEVPVLFITGEAMRACDGPVLKKPFNGQRLLTAVRALIGQQWN